VVSRILSRMIIYLEPPSPAASSGLYAESDEQPTLRHDSAALQRTGFTSRTGHPDWLWALTPLVSPLPGLLGHTGGIVSVALSLRSPAVAVSNRPALRCPDFPHPAF